MKKSLFLSLLLAIGISGMAQNWVTIPDATFAQMLNFSYPDCMNGNQMNTECPEIVNEIYLYLSYFYIEDLTGIEYFVNLEVLNCSENSLSWLPNLPSSIQYLYCEYNNLTELPDLPASLKYLYCSYNDLTSLPQLPSSLLELWCPANNISVLPELPASLGNLFCHHNNLISLPELPESLIDLTCYSNNLNSLPELPQSLINLKCYNNNLTSLPDLPQTLNQLLCMNNQITCFPTLPNNLTQSISFNIGNNPFTCLPNYVPAMTEQWLSYPLCEPTDLVNNPYGCGSMIPTSVIDHTMPELLVFPNPGTGWFNVSVPNGANSFHQSTLEIYNLSGQRILQQHMNENQTVIDLSNQPSGIYMLRMQNTFGTKTMKLVKQ